MNDQQLKTFHEQFKTDHHRQRNALIDQLQPLPTPRPAKARRWIPALSSLAAMLGIALIAWYFASVGTGEISWAQVSRQLQQVRTFTYHYSDCVQHMNGPIYNDISRHWFRLPYQERTQVDSNGTVWLVNPTGHAHTVISFETDGNPGVLILQNVLMGTVHNQDYPAEWLHRLRDMTGEGVVKKGEEVLDGRKVIRFEEPGTVFGPSEPKGIITVWVDAGTSLPVRLTTTATILNQGQMETHSVELNDMKFDQPLDDNLFTMPDLNGKKVSQSITISVAAGTQWPQNILKITTADGQSLASSADLRPTQVTLINRNARKKMFEMIPDAAKRIESFTRNNVGQKLTIQLDQGKSQTVEILGTINRVSVAVQSSEPQPATSSTAEHGSH